jgi:putative DNA primase/helicase
MIDWHGPTRQPCPDCGRGPKDRTCGVTLNDDQRSGITHCFRCGYRERYSIAAGIRIHPGKAVSRPVAPLKRDDLSPGGLQLFDACQPLAGTVGEQYLTARGCVVPPSDGALRIHPNLKHPSGYVGPALVALVTHVQTGQPMSIHKTWFRPNGDKADCAPPRLLLGGHRKAGGVIRLWPDEAVTSGLGIAEGIETALSLAHAFKPVWACIDAGNLKTLPALPGIEALTIAVDNDAAGIAAAQACTDAWTRAGRHVRWVLPETAKTDLNDVAREAA